METTTTHQDEAAAKVNEGVEALGAAADGLLSMAGLWLHHGLRVGRLSLQAGAQTLERAATALGELSRRLEQAGRPGAGS